MDDTSDFAQTCVGTPYYLSPELIEGRPYNQLSDVWALGVLLFQMVAFQYPFDAPTLPALALKIVNGEHHPLPEDTPTDLRELLAILLSRSQSHRPNMEAVMLLPVVAKRRSRFESEMRKLWRAAPASLSTSSQVAPGSDISLQRAQDLLPNSVPRPAAVPAESMTGDSLVHHEQNQVPPPVADAPGMLVQPSPLSSATLTRTVHASPAPFSPSGPVADTCSSSSIGNAGNEDIESTAPKPLSTRDSNRATSSSLPSASASNEIAAYLPSSYAAPFPLEPTPLDVPAADRELLASQVRVESLLIATTCSRQAV